MKHARKYMTSLRTQLIVLVCMVTLLPFSAGQWLSNRRTVEIVEENIRASADQNVRQMEMTLDAVLASYEDLLGQLYTDDTIVEVVDKLASGEDVAVGRNQLRRATQGRAYAKPYLQAITIVFEDGTFYGYDKLTASSTRSSWLDAEKAQALYEAVSPGNDTLYLPTDYAMSVADRDNYLFHIAHRVIDYRHVEKRQAVVVLSVDEELLRSICNPDWSRAGAADSFCLLAERAGQIVSAPVQTLIGRPLTGSPADYAQQCGLLDGDALFVSTSELARAGWGVYSFQDQSTLYAALGRQQTLTAWLIALSILALVCAIIVLVRLLTRSLSTVTGAMQKAAAGDLTVRVRETARMPQETAVIARQFNAMMDDINALMQDVRNVSEQQRQAEIAMLEAQINPHFLYNTLDTINWMAIDQDAYDVSNAITSLARILRYGIENSNQLVTVRQELDWLRQYLTLQQMRLKNSLDAHIDASEDVLALPIHKLLLQPFVENAILHGFDGVKRMHTLQISIIKEEAHLRVVIADNGKGMTQAQCDALLQGASDDDKHHIGVRNAVQRMRMYYGGDVSVSIGSAPDHGTQVTLLLPLAKGE